MPELLSYLGAGLAVMLALAMFLRLFYLLEKFTCGSYIEDVIEEAKYYNSLGLRVLIHYAAEDSGAKGARIALKKNLELLDAVDREKIVGDLSVKPTGLVDRNSCLEYKKRDLASALAILRERMDKCPQKK